MIVNYAKKVGTEGAIRKTFDGKRKVQKIYVLVVIPDNLLKFPYNVPPWTLLN
jgi:hypothetical protein